MNALVAVFLLAFATNVEAMSHVKIGQKCNMNSDCGTNEYCAPTCPVTTTTTTGPTTTTTTGPTTTVTTTTVATTTTTTAATTIDGFCAANPTTTTAAAGGPGTADAYMKGASLPVLAVAMLLGMKF